MKPFTLFISLFTLLVVPVASSAETDYIDKLDEYTKSGNEIAYISCDNFNSATRVIKGRDRERGISYNLATTVIRKKSSYMLYLLDVWDLSRDNFLGTFFFVEEPVSSNSQEITGSITQELDKEAWEEIVARDAPNYFEIARKRKLNDPESETDCKFSIK